MLTRTMADLNREQQALRKERSVAHTEKGTPVVNPRKAVVQMHASSILSFRRPLSLRARVKRRGARCRGRRERSVQSAPVTIGRFSELEHHGERGLARETALGLVGPQARSDTCDKRRSCTQ
jgi:hypothetical protein